MKTSQFVAIATIDNGINKPGEFCIAGVDARGHLRQGAGEHPGIVDIIATLVSHKQLNGEWSDLQTEGEAVLIEDPRVTALRKLVEGNPGNFVPKAALLRVLELEETTVYGEGE
jgi:hypothetical protein